MERVDTKSELMSNLAAFQNLQEKKIDDFDNRLENIAKVASKMETNVSEASSSMKEYLEKKIKNHDDVIELRGVF